MTKKGDFCGHKWPKGIICTHEIFFHFKKFWKTVSNGSKQMEMMFLQVFFNFDLFKHIYNQIYGEKKGIFGVLNAFFSCNFSNNLIIVTISVANDKI